MWDRTCDRSADPPEAVPLPAPAVLAVPADAVALAARLALGHPDLLSHRAGLLVFEVAVHHPPLRVRGLGAPLAVVALLVPQADLDQLVRVHLPAVDRGEGVRGDVPVRAVRPAVGQR